jgi:hypothetical protein
VLSRPDEALELVEALRSELEAVRRGLAELPALREEVAALRSELAASRALPPGASPERIDRALEVEMASERPPAVEERPGGGESTGDALGGADGPVVRAARWLERRLRGGRG